MLGKGQLSLYVAVRLVSLLMVHDANRLRI